VIAQVCNIESTGSNGSEIIKLVALEWAKDFNSLLDIADKFWNSGGIGECGITRDEGFETFVDLPSLNTEEEGF
jgi:hypothetical protein